MTTQEKSRKKIVLIFIFALFIIPVFLAACNGDYTTYAQEPKAEAEPNEYAAIDHEDRDVQDTHINARYLEDIDFLYETLVSNFPFINALNRRNIDLSAQLAAARNDIETHPNMSDDIFVEILQHRIFRRVFGFAHLSILDDSWIKNLIAYYLHTDFYAASRAFLEIVNNPATRAFYNLDDSHFMPAEQPARRDDETEQAATGHSANISTDILKEGLIAYIHISRMSSVTSDLDRLLLLDFFEQTADYAHLIVDIRGNPGGGANYFYQLVVAPNIAEPLYYYAHAFLMAGENNMKFIDSPHITLSPVTDQILADFEHLDPEIANSFDYFAVMQSVIHPSENEPIFGGQFWLLIDEVNFSASDFVAAMARQTDFAILVGEQTSGGGLGTVPAVLTLPNTGIAFRYRKMYVVDSYGRNNYEHGTLPHFHNFDGMDALQTVLILINEL